MAKKKVLFGITGAGGVSALSPVIDKLRKDEDLEVIVLDNDKIGEKTKKWSELNIPYKTLSDYGLSEASQENVTKIVESENPDLVVGDTAGASDVGRYAIAAGREKGKNTTAFIDYWSNYADRFTLNGERNAALPDTVFIIDELMRREAVKEGLLEDRLRISGHPGFDQLPSYVKGLGEEKIKEIREYLKVPEGALMVFYSTGYFNPETQEEYKRDYGANDYEALDTLCKGLERVGAKIPNIFLVAKNHPGDKGGFEQGSLRLQEFLKKYKIQFNVTDKKYRGTEIAAASDFVTSLHSTVNTEAVLMGKYGVAIQPGMFREKDPLIASKGGYIPIASSVEDVVEIVGKGLSDENYRQELARMAEPFRRANDGQATQRLIDGLYSLLGVEHAYAQARQESISS